MAEYRLAAALDLVRAAEEAAKQSYCIREMEDLGKKLVAKLDAPADQCVKTPISADSVKAMSKPKRKSRTFLHIIGTNSPSSAPGARLH